MSPSVMFRLRGVQACENQRVAVVGSSLSLGSWIPKKTCFLQQSAGDTQELRITLEGSTAEYKYVILHGEEIQWEGGANRVVDIDSVDVECNDTWISDGASDFIARTDGGDVPEDLDVDAQESLSKAHEGAVVVHEHAAGNEDAAIPPKDSAEAREVAGETHEGFSVCDRDSSKAGVDENTQVEEKLSPEKEQTQMVQQSDPKNAQHRERDSGDTKEPFVETRVRRSPFLLIDCIFKLCRRRMMNAN